MAYCTQADITPRWVSEETLVMLTNPDDASAVTVDTTVLAGFIASADAEIDGYIGHRYALPLPSTPRIVTMLSARLTRYMLYTARPGEPDEAIKDDYDRITALLTKISKGELSIGLTAAGADPAASPAPGPRVQKTSRAPVFGRANMEDY